MSLPAPWIERIFDKLTLVYGHQFLSRWDGINLIEVKADWAHELRGFAQNPGAIAYGLEHLPAGKAPTVIEFRAVCNSPQAPQPERPIAIPYAPAPVVDEGARTVERLKLARAQIPNVDGSAWAFALELKDREDPKVLTPTVRAMYREVLANWQRRHPGKPLPLVQRNPEPQRRAA